MRICQKKVERGLEIYPVPLRSSPFNEKCAEKSLTNTGLARRGGVRGEGLGGGDCSGLDHFLNKKGIVYDK